MRWAAFDAVLSSWLSKACASHTAWCVAGHTAETGVLPTQLGGPGSPSKLDKIAEAAAAAVIRKQSQVPIVAGIVKSANAWDTSGDISVTIYPACKAHAQVPGSCCTQVSHPVVGLYHTLSTPVLGALQSAATASLNSGVNSGPHPNAVYQHKLVCRCMFNQQMQRRYSVTPHESQHDCTSTMQHCHVD